MVAHMEHCVAPPPLDLGGVRISFPVALAPMAGYTDSAFRCLCRRFGCGLVFTEVVNAQAINHGSRRTFHLLEADPAERPAVAHLYGREPDDLARAAETVARLRRYDLIDLNTGCPVRKIVAKGCGAALMSEPGRIGRIVRAIRDAAPLPVTVKTRLGLTPERTTVFDVARAVEDAGGCAIAVHARYASQRHAGGVDLAALAALKARCAIPVFGNGSIRTAADAARMWRETGVDGIMIGRGAVGNPWIFREIRGMFDGRVPPRPSERAVRAVIAEQLAGLVALKGLERRYRRPGALTAETAAALHFRGHLHRYLAGRPGWGTVRRRLQEVNSPAAVMAAVDEAMSDEGGRDDAE